MGYPGFGTVNIDGCDIELKRVGGDLPESNFAVGRGGHQVWKGKNTILRMDYVFTWLCPEDQENCEVYYYKGILDVTYKKTQRKVRSSDSVGLN